MRMLTVNQVAELLSVRHETVRRLIKAGHLPAHKIGTHVIRIKSTDLEQYLDEPPGQLEALADKELQT